MIVFFSKFKQYKSEFRVHDLEVLVIQYKRWMGIVILFYSFVVSSNCMNCENTATNCIIHYSPLHSWLALVFPYQSIFYCLFHTIYTWTYLVFVVKRRFQIMLIESKPYWPLLLIIIQGVNSTQWDRNFCLSFFLIVKSIIFFSFQMDLFYWIVAISAKE